MGIIAINSLEIICGNIGKINKFVVRNEMINGKLCLYYRNTCYPKLKLFGHFQLFDGLLKYLKSKARSVSLIALCQTVTKKNVLPLIESGQIFITIRDHIC